MIFVKEEYRNKVNDIIADIKCEYIKSSDARIVLRRSVGLEG